MSNTLSKLAALTIALAASSVTYAAPINVGVFGQGGWRSDDTRNAAGLSLVGTVNTHPGTPNQAATASDDVEISQQIQFVGGPAGSTYGGAVSIDGTVGNSGKSTISAINPTTGFGSGASLLNTFNATYEWYGQPNPTSRTLAFKLGIQSTNWGTGAGQSQNGFVADRPGEPFWDLVLVHLPAPSDNAWSTVSVDHDTGNWNLFRQAGNAFYPAPDGTAKTLDAWALDPTFGTALFGAGAKVTSVQFGLGSSQRNSIAYVDYLQTNLLNGGDVINFVAVPEPTTLAAVGLASVLLRRRRAN